MPYFIFRIPPSGKPLEYLDTKEGYRNAKELVTRLRDEAEPEDESVIRMVFAGSTTEAEKLLLTPRDDRIIGDD